MENGNHILRKRTDKLKRGMKRELIVIIGLIITILFLSGCINNSCDDCYTITGYLIGYCDDSRFHYMINRTDEWSGMDKVYCSEGFPNNFESYFGKHVEIKGHASCGRRSINSIKEVR